MIYILLYVCLEYFYDITQSSSNWHTSLNGEEMGISYTL